MVAARYRRANFSVSDKPDFLANPLVFSKTSTGNSGETRAFFISGDNDARYLDPRTSRWISADPAMGEYIPQAPINDDAKKHNKNLPGMGGIFNTMNMHAFHYAGNNPINLTDPDGKIITTIPILRQSDPRYSGMDLGGMQSYDWYNSTTGAYKLNNIGDYGCKFMAAVSIGAALFCKNSTTHMTDTENFPKYFNLGDSFDSIVKNKKGGFDINMTDRQFIRLVTQISGNSIRWEVFDKSQGSIGEKLKALNESSTQYYVTAQFSKAGVTDSHFAVLDGITVDANGKVSIQYTEQYAGFKDGTFNENHIVKLIIIWE